jgi:hypothetical protein
MSSGVIEAVDGSTGKALWSFKEQTVIASDQGVSAYVAGSHLLLAGAGSVAVIDRGGVVVGRGTTTRAAAIPGDAYIHPDPTGTRWAWSTIDRAPQAIGGSTAPADQWSGAVWVAGIGEAPHRVQQWTEPSATSVEVFLWSDRGIVTAVVPGTCAPTAEETSTAILDPATGRSTPLQGGDRHVVDVHRGLVLAMRQPETLLVSGDSTFTVTGRPVSNGEHLADAAISPDGAHVYGSLTAMSGCGGVPEVRTMVIDVAAQHTTVLTGMYASGWYDDAHLVVHGAEDHDLRVVDLAGAGGGTVLARGFLVGVLR